MLNITFLYSLHITKLPYNIVTLNIIFSFIFPIYKFYFFYHCFPQTGNTALHIAASYGQEDFVREMLTQVPATITSEKPTENNDADVS